MFATLVVELPSDHDGGALSIEHNGRVIDVQPAGVSLDRVHWTAFYTDCVHELKPVTRGVRAVLVYNLCRVGSGHISSVHEGHQSNKDQLVEVLNQWTAHAATMPEWLVVPL